MRLFELVSAPWAVLPATLDEIRNVYEAHVRDERIDIAAVEARLGRPLNNEQKPYQVTNGVAIVPVMGVLAKRANLFQSVSGGASTQIIGNMVNQAADDPSVKAIVLSVDSPGGAVDGVQQLADKVRAVRGKKPIVTVADGQMASGGYWIGSAADEVYIADRTTVVGSIGVVYTHTDTSKQDEARGVKRTDITAGKYKRIAGQHEPLSDEGRATIQVQADHLYSVFVHDVAENRKVPVDQVLSDMADGRVFVGQQAIDAGLVDGVATLDDVVARLSGKPARVNAAQTNQPTQPTQSKGNHRMDLNTLKAEHADVYNAVLEEGREAGASAERARILGIEAHAFPGHEKAIAEMKADGKTTPDQAAARILTAQRETLAKAGMDLRTDAPPVVPNADAATESEKGDAVVAKAQALAREKSITLVAALKELGVK
ncbi:signal peptide peptidase SppA [Paraburkholderia tropica]|uniref:signal peptide peptidase SppA n=1 Tax=Paraburkholderia tropica TaxID=92647 RepID=UPI0016097BAE|nr:signal peptide peptidase SppA [Paraburkholderia tropica]MBB6319252.1 signal peptide peptidase SppA [Paraburkholderia tropica]